jgi:general secretion pathway protein D
MRQTRRRRKTSGWFGYLISLTCFTIAGCQTVAPPPLPPPTRNVTVGDQTRVEDTHAAARLKLQARFREGMDLYDAGRHEEGLAVLRAVLRQCGDEGIALPSAMDAQLRATLAQTPAAPASQPPQPKPITRAASAPAKGSPPEKTLPVRNAPPPDITEVRLPALTDPAMADQLIPMDFNQADIRIVIKAISELTGLNFLVDENVKGTVTLISPTKVRRGDAYKVLQSILESKGFATSPAGNLIKIMPRAEINKRNLPYGIGSDPAQVPANDTLATWIIPLTYASASDVIGAITPLLSGTVAAYPQTNSLMITDTCSNIRRVLEIVRHFDVPGEEQALVVLPLRHAEAGQLSQEILQVLEKQTSAAPAGEAVPARPGPGRSAPAPVSGPPAAGSRSGPTIVPEMHTNSLIVVASAPVIDSIEELVSELDTERSLNTSNIHVVYLENGEAKDMAKSLETALQGSAAQKGATAKPESVHIQADESTNALIIVASPEDYEVVASVVKQLDIPRDQVLVELRIVEVSEDLLRNIGVEWSTFDAASPNGVRGFAGTSYGLANEFTAGTLTGGAVGAFKQVGGATKVGALLALLEQRTGVNILSTPTIVTANHQKAQITVAENIPYIKESSVTFQTSTNPQQVNTFDYKDVGVILELTPHISHGGLVRMEIDSTFSQVIQGATGTSVNTPTTSKRAEKTTVSIQNGATIVVGGLISDNKTVVLQKVPILGSIPLIGFLFQNKNTTIQQTNLLMFITPHVLTNPKDVAARPTAE